MKNTCRHFAAAILALALVLSSAGAATVLDSTLVGTHGNYYNDPANWSPPEVPNNTATRRYNVTAPEGFYLDINATISNLTTDGALSSVNGSLTVTGATTLQPIHDAIGTENIDLRAASGAPIVFALGSLSTFANGVLAGTYYLSGPATLQFTGADVRRLSDAELTLVGESSIVDENGADGLRNLARIGADSTLKIALRQFITAGDFTVDGSLVITNTSNAPGLFVVTGSLTNFDGASRTLRDGSYRLTGVSPNVATLQFPGADIVNNGATISLFGPSAIVDEVGRDALRNFSHNLPTGSVTLYDRPLTTSGNFTNDGVLEVAGSAMTVSGALTNFDAASKTLNGGTYRLQSSGRLIFPGADIVHNNASLVLSGAITDENGNDALRNFIDNQAGGAVQLSFQSFTAASDFTNAGSLTLYAVNFAVPAEHVYLQTGGTTNIDGGKLNGAMDVEGGELIAESIPPSAHIGYVDSGSTATITGNVTIGAATLNPSQLTVNGNVQLSGGSTLHFVANSPSSGKDVSNAGLNISGTLALAGKLEVEYPAKFPPASTTTYVIANAASFTGGFSNVAPGSRITTTDGAASFLFQFNSQGQMVLTDYQPTIPPAQLLNISTRAQVLTGDDVAIGGFIVVGTESKKVLVRALGPSLAAAGVEGALQDPIVELRDSRGAVVTTNDNWQDTQASDISATGLAPGDSRESAIVTTLRPGSYTAVLRGKNDTTGVALLEIYDLAKNAHAKLANISTRGFVDADHVLIGGLIAGGNGQGNAELVVRAIGFGLQFNGVQDYLPDPALELHDSNGALVVANDDSNQPASNYNTMPQELLPRYAQDSATGVNVPPGNYTVVVRGKDGASGNALVEIYDLNR